MWCDGFDFSSKNTSWFEKQYARVSKKNRNGKQNPPKSDNKKEEEDKHSSTRFIDLNSIQESHRETLGLSLSGPLNLEDVKTAYRACEMKWHPDRHDDSTKIELCNVAYQSICEKLAMN